MDGSGAALDQDHIRGTAHAKDVVKRAEMVSFKRKETYFPQLNKICQTYIRLIGLGVLIMEP